MIDTRSHDPAGCDCDPCNPQAHPEAAPDLCNCLEDGLRASLTRWRDSCVPACRSSRRSTPERPAPNYTVTPDDHSALFLIIADRLPPYFC